MCIIYFRFSEGIPANVNNNKNDQNKRIEEVSSREDLTIHVVGARAAEIQDVTIWEILPLRLPNLKHLTVVFVGPELRLIRYLKTHKSMIIPLYI